MGKKRIKNVGLPLGQVVFAGTQRIERVEVHHLQYNAEYAKELQIDRGVANRTQSVRCSQLV